MIGGDTFPTQMYLTSSLKHKLVLADMPTWKAVFDKAPVEASGVNFCLHSQHIYPADSHDSDRDAEHKRADPTCFGVYKFLGILLLDRPAKKRKSHNGFPNGATTQSS